MHCIRNPPVKIIDAEFVVIPHTLGESLTHSWIQSERHGLAHYTVCTSELSLAASLSMRAKNFRESQVVTEDLR